MGPQWVHGHSPLPRPSDKLGQEGNAPRPMNVCKALVSDPCSHTNHLARVERRVFYTGRSI